MAAALKLNIPPKGAGALKVCFAAALYDVPVQLCKVDGEEVVLELVKEQKFLIEANAIVRYFSVIGSSPWAATAGAQLQDLSLAEWEEVTLSRAVGPKNKPEETLKLVESKITSAPIATGSPAELILFSALYDTATNSPKLLEGYPGLKAWFIKTSETSWAKKGIASASPAVAQPKASKHKAGPKPVIVEDRPEIAVVRKLRDGALMIVPKAGKDILPNPGKKNILITSALPYVNNVPHLGNIIGSVLSADVFSRYHKARNDNTLYICGTDEYGTATETKALEEKCTPKELCDKYHVLHRDIYKWFDIGFDYFGRTTTQEQTEISQDIFLKLKQHEYLVEDTMHQLYCEKHDGFLADRFVEGTCPKCQYEDARGDQCDKCGGLLDAFDLINPRCKIDGNTPIPRDSQHIFIQLDKLQPQIDAWVRKSSDEGQWSRNGRIITESWLKEGLKQRCITRDLKWGTPVPLEGYEKKVLYVWFDACIGYVSITANYTKEWRKWWLDPDNVKLYQFMGKDNVPFHTVIFPGSQLGTNDPWTMLHHISTTEYLQYEGGKFSKSRGIGVFGNNAQATGIPPSVWRYYLLSSRPETGDTQFVWKDFITKNNSELIANFGNFVNRVIKFTTAKYYGVTPDYTVPPSDAQASIKSCVDDVNKLLAEYIHELENVHLRAGLEKAMAISGRGNLFLQDNKLDNALFANSPQRCAAVVGLGMNLIYLISAVIYPYMPATAEAIVRQLNAPLRRIPDAGEEWDKDLLPGHVIGKPELLFAKIDEKKAEEWKANYGGQHKEGAATAVAKAAPAKKGKGGGKKGDGTEKKKKGGALPAEKVAKN